MVTVRKSVGETSRVRRGAARRYQTIVAILVVCAVGLPGRDNVRPQFTDHCFTGDYPTPLTDLVGEHAKQTLSLFAEAG